MALVLGELATILKAQVEPFERDLRKARQAFNKHKDSLKAGAAVAGAAIAAGLGAGLLGAMNLSSAQTKLRNQLGDPVAAEAAGAAAAGSFGRGFTATIDEAMADASTVFGSGLTGGSQNAAMIEDLTVKAQALSKTFEFDLTKATSVAGIMMRDGLAKDGSDALDLLAAASQRVAPQFREDVLDAAHEYGQFFANVGFDGPQAFELLARGAEQGMYGIDKTGDAIKEFSIRATDLSTATGEAFDAIGLDSHKMANDLLAGGDTAKAAFDKTVAALLAIKDPAKQAEAAIALFGTPLEDLNVTEIPAFLASMTGVGDGMTDVAGKAGEMADAFEKDAGQQLQALKNQIQQALIEKLAAAVPYLRATFGWLSENSSWVGPLAVGLGVLAGAIAVIIGALKVWAAVQVVLNLALWTSPITWIVLGVLALVAVIVLIATKTTWFQDAWAWAWGGIKAGAEAVWNWVRDNWPLLIGIITGPIGWVVLLVVKYWDQISGAAQAAWNWIKDNWPLLVGIITGPIGWIALLVMAYWDEISGATSAAWNWIKKVVVGAWEDVRFKAVTVWNWLKSVPGRMKEAYANLASIITAPFRAGFNAISRAWNNGPGRLSFTVPDWVPGLKGRGFSMPNMPMLAKGGNIMAAGMAIVGDAGPEMLHLPRGAQVEPLSGGGRSSQHAESRVTLIIRGDGVVAGIREDIRIKGGGDVVRHLTPQTGGGWS